MSFYVLKEPTGERFLKKSEKSLVNSWRFTLSKDINETRIFNNVNSARSEAVALLVAIENDPVLKGGTIAVENIATNSAVLLTDVNKKVGRYIESMTANGERGILVAPYDPKEPEQLDSTLSISEMEYVIRFSQVNNYKGFFQLSEDETELEFHIHQEEQSWLPNT